jgi:hypothetical protein
VVPGHYLLDDLVELVRVVVQHPPAVVRLGHTFAR